ncbi:carbon-nitrogen hydrolase family protein [Alicyclobacillus sp. SO9]|uniref:carbon-nitrogen hydrolase family protein n=1 Tax=Alicyclobacillus sp. SO9 TaxID=2665646 RepID=UPI0018E7E4F9|nr:carbon-nitrogen hydrolase family protein [Alicyclobacillus sp. SO9]QQE79305.1 carbon-nitrogen hydrolase family protein [Alicyclobacillus sp. SO9]
MTAFKLGVYQGQPVQGNIEGTLQLMEQVIAEAGEKSVQILVFPELFITGYLPELWEHVPSQAEEEEWMNRLTQSARQHDVWIVFGHPSYRVSPLSPLDERSNARVHEGSNERTDNRIDNYGDSHSDEHIKHPSGPYIPAPFTNGITLLSPDGVVGTYAKVHLFGDEPKTFVYGSEFPVWDTPFGRVALQSCYDIEFPESARMAAVQGAQLLINPANNMSPFGEHHRRYSMVRAMENSLFVITVNRLGPEKDIDFCGKTCVAHPEGRWLLETDREEGLQTTEIDLSDIASLDPSVHYLNQRRPALYRALIESKDARQ